MNCHFALQNHLPLRKIRFITSLSGSDKSVCAVFGFPSRANGGSTLQGGGGYSVQNRAEIFCSACPSVAAQRGKWPESERVRGYGQRGCRCRAAILIWSAIPAVVLAVLDAPIAAGQAQQTSRVALLGPKTADAQSGFF